MHPFQIGNPTGFLPGLREHREQNRRQNGNDRDDDQQLNQRKASAGVAIIACTLFRSEIPRAFSRACANTGNRIAARMAMIAMTTNNSISVKPRRESRSLHAPFSDRKSHGLSPGPARTPGTESPPEWQ